MIDKDKIIKELKEVLDSLDITSKYRFNIIRAIEYLQEEPVSEDLEEAIEDAMPDANWYIEEYNDTTCEDAYNSIQMGNMFRDGAKWQKAKDESVTKDLENYINELSKQFPEVSFAKLSRIAVRVAKWQKAKERNL